MIAFDMRLGISIAAGVVAAGLAWFLWDLAQNFRDALRRRKARRAAIGLSGLGDGES